MLLQIRHTGKSENGQPLFVIVNGRKQTETPVPIASPWEIMIGTQSLRQGLQWYLEKYLELPIDNFRKRAEEVLTALSQWGQDCVKALFSEEHARCWYRDEQKERFTNLQLEIVSDDAEVLSWPWEVLESRDNGLLALECHIERRLEKIGDACSISKKLPQEQLNILYIIARPYGDHDIGFQTLARPLIDFVNKGGWPVHIDVLRPPTFDKLRAVLKENPDFYHIVHFDGHGGFDDNYSASGGYMDPHAKQAKYTGQSGKLVFEKDDTKYSPDEIPAAMLGELLRKHSIPVMVLNACQSAMHTSDPFASVAVSLLRAGIRGVVAMSYSLWVRGAEVFVPEFYKSLFKAGDLATAMQAGRREMFNNQMRNTFSGQVPFHDWMVPVLYQQEAEGILPKLDPGERHKSGLPSEMQELGDYGFIGVIAPSKSRNKPAGILIRGMEG
ncbi:MAG: CHAT domain-containing protein [Clostridiales bacterium]|nr:CHAT domain-containing protein [Clostridiales bacterium]